MGPTKSELWKYFTRLGSNEVKCKICFKTLKSSGNTSNMKKHLQKHPLSSTSSENPNAVTERKIELPPKWPKIQEQQPSSSRETMDITPCDSLVPYMQLSDNSSEAEGQPPTKKKQLSIGEMLQRKVSYSEGGRASSQLCKLLLYFICVDKRPFDIVKGHGFQKLMRHACPSFKIPSVDTLKENLDSFYTIMHSKIELKFDTLSHISLTCDIWTEMMTATSYLGVTAHYLDDNKLTSRCIATIALDQRHTGDYLSEQMQEICQGIKIKPEKITAIITDNGANMIAGVTKFVGKEKHLSCFAHTVNLIAESAMLINDFNLLYNKVREVVKYFKASVIQSDLLRQNQTGPTLKLILDTKTRWNSVYYMLQRYIELAPVVHQILMLNTKAPPTPSAVEMQNIKDLLRVLKPLEHVSKEISGEQYVTISKVIPMINCLKAQIDALNVSSDSVAGALKSEVMKQIQRRFGQVEDSHLVAISCLLDPRFKNIHFQDARSCARTISMIRRLTATNPASTGNSSETDSDSSVETSYDFWSHHKTLAHAKQKKRQDTPSSFLNPQSSVNLKDEMTLYLATPVSPLSTNPFEQWEEMKSVFPHLYKLAKEYLAIPATSVPSERLFSKAGTTLSKTRNRLSPKRLNKLLFLSDCTEEEWEI